MSTNRTRHTRRKAGRLLRHHLRDGEQSPGSSLNASEKLEIAHQLARLGVDVIEAGFPASSPGDFEAVQAIAREVKGPVICGLARCVESDIRTCWDAIKDAERPRIHTFVSTSDIHLEHQMRATRAEVIDLTRRMVELSVSLCPADVEFSAMDATRSDVDFLAEVLRTAIDAGATTINVPDTVGYTLPTEYAALMDSLYEKVPGLEQRGAERALPQRPGAGGGQLPGRGGAGRHPGGGGRQRSGRTGRQRRPGRSGHGPGHPSRHPAEAGEHRHRRDLPHQPHGIELHRADGAGEQGDRGQECVRSRIRHPPGRAAEGAHHLRDHARQGHRADRVRHRAGQALRAPRSAHAPGRTRHPSGGRRAGRSLPPLQRDRRQEEGSHLRRPRSPRG